MRGGTKADPTFLSRNLGQEEGATGGCETDNESPQEELQIRTNSLGNSAGSPAGKYPKRAFRRANLIRSHSCNIDGQGTPSCDSFVLSGRKSVQSNKETGPVTESHNPSRLKPFTLSNCDDLSNSRSSSGSRSGDSRREATLSDSAMDKKGVWKSINGAKTEINKETRRVLGFFKRKLRTTRGKKETAVKEIHIAPDEDEERWACRSVGDNTNDNSSRASSSTTYYSNSRESTNLEVVHDMDDEYNPQLR